MPKNSNIHLMSDHDIIHLYEETHDERFKTLAERAKARLARVQQIYGNMRVEPIQPLLTSIKETEVCST